MGSIDVIGVPSSMGAFAPGQERAPAALRRAGLIPSLERAGVEVRDVGDGELRRWLPDREHPFAQHVEAVRDVALETAERVSAADGDMTLVLGGDCTIELGTLAGLQQRLGGRVGLVYFDLHADMNTPTTVRWGALDSMGIAHALGDDLAEPALSTAFPRTPLLRPEELWLFGHGREEGHERERISALGIDRTTVEEVAADPEASAERTLDAFAGRVDQLAVHLDVDVIDFVDLPLQENVDRNEGLSFDATMAALGVLLAHPTVTSFTICELNPDHDPDGSAVPRFVEGIVGALTSRIVSGRRG
ncbi:MAG TPA: arginase family protein [Actinomycetota bacterium]|nr:arginase family protein [Actinomycetota bacterium]